MSVVFSSWQVNLKLQYFVKKNVCDCDCSDLTEHRVMENEEARKEYLVYPKSKNQCHNQKGRKIPLKGNGRRIDYILYREDGLQPEWKVVCTSLW